MRRESIKNIFVHVFLSPYCARTLFFTHIVEGNKHYNNLDNSGPMVLALE